MSDDGQRDPDAPIERLEEFGRRVVRVVKDDFRKLEERADEIVDEPLIPVPAGGPALPDEANK